MRAHDEVAVGAPVGGGALTSNESQTGLRAKRTIVGLPHESNRGIESAGRTHSNRHRAHGMAAGCRKLAGERIAILRDLVTFWSQA